MAAPTSTGTVLGREPDPGHLARHRGLRGRMRALIAVGVLGGSLTLGGCATPEGNAALLGAGLGVLVGVALASDYDDDKHYRGHRHGHHSHHGYYADPCPRGYYRRY